MYRKSAGFLLVTLTFVMVSNAQFSKGMRTVGASVASGFFNSGKYEYTFPAPTAGYNSDANSFGINVTPDMGWFISDNMVIGARLSAGYNYEKNIDAFNNVTFRKGLEKKLRLGLGAYARNYFAASGSFKPFGELHLDAGIGSASTEGFTYTSVYRESYEGKSSGDFFADAGLSIGATKMITPHTGLDFFAGYTYSYNKNTYKTTRYRDVDINGSIDETAVENPTTKITNHGFTFGIGFRIFLEKRK